jgi:hypothetical protein
MEEKTVVRLAIWVEDFTTVFEAGICMYHHSRRQQKSYFPQVHYVTTLISGTMAAVFSKQ